MRNAPNDGREANEQGFYLHECPLFLDSGRRDAWIQAWNDAQIDREIWESQNNERAVLNRMQDDDIREGNRSRGWAC